MKFEILPPVMQNDYVKDYLQKLNLKKLSFFLKRMFDFLVSLIMIIFLIPFFTIISIIIKFSSKGPIIYKQKRVTKNCKIFMIYKFRTMINNADKIGSEVTIDNDKRITRFGKLLRKLRFDEFPQLFNILKGDMSFVGPRPEVVKYVEKYTDKMYVTLLVKAGVTSPASIKYKNEFQLLKDCINVDEAYVNLVLPEKMEYNYLYLQKFNFFRDISILFKTLLAVLFN